MLWFMGGGLRDSRLPLVLFVMLISRLGTVGC